MAEESSDFLIELFKPLIVHYRNIKREKITMEISKREKEILILISNGMSNKAAASELGISPNTVQTYRRRLLLKLNAKNSADLIRIAFQSRILGA